MKEDKLVTIKQPKDDINKESAREQQLSNLLIKEFEKDKNIFPMRKIGLMLIAYVILIIISLLKGSDHTKSILGIQS